MFIINSFGRTNGQIKKFHERGGKLFIIYSGDNEHLLEEAKNFLKRQGIPYEAARSKGAASAVVDHQEGKIYECNVFGVKDMQAYEHVYAYHGGVIADFDGGKTRIKHPQLVHKQFRPLLGF